MHWSAGDSEVKPNAVIDERVVLDPTIRAPLRREVFGNPSPMPERRKSWVLVE